jgi:hypothetical protein
MMSNNLQRAFPRRLGSMHYFASISAVPIST